MDMLPKEFEPRRTDRWLLCLPGIDAFLVHRIEGPSLKPSNQECQMTIELHNAVGSQQNNELKAWLSEPETRSGNLKFLDPMGVVDETWNFNAKPTEMSFSTLDYGESSLFLTKLTLAISDLSIDGRTT